MNQTCSAISKEQEGCTFNEAKQTYQIRTPKEFYREHYHDIKFAKVTKVPYTQPQTFLFLDFTTGTVSEALQATLMIPADKHSHDFSIFGEEIDTRTDFEQKGRIIGNMALEKKRLQSTSAKISKPSTSDIVQPTCNSFWKDPSPNRSHYEYADGRLIPLKFIIILNRILALLERTRTHTERGEPVRTAAAVFSHYTHLGTDAFAEYVRYVQQPNKDGTEKTIPTYDEDHGVFSTTDIMPVRSDLKIATFGVDTQTDVQKAHIVLLPNVKEGANLVHVQQLHVMEPMLSYTDKIQLSARINRFQEKKTCEIKHKVIYQYCMDTSDFCNHLIMKMKQWHFRQHKQNSWVFWKRFKRFDQDITPDSIIMQNQLNAEALIEKLKFHLGPLSQLQHNTLIKDPTGKTKRKKKWYQLRSRINQKLWLAVDTRKQPMTFFEHGTIDQFHNEMPQSVKTQRGGSFRKSKRAFQRSPPFVHRRTTRKCTRERILNKKRLKV